MALNTNYNFYRRLPITKNAFAGLLTLDLDNAAERFAVCDRDSFVCYASGLVALNVVAGIISVVVPYVYTTAPKLIVLMMDDTNVYNAAAADKVTADVIDLVTTAP